MRVDYPSMQNSIPIKIYVCVSCVCLYQSFVVFLHFWFRCIVWRPFMLCSWYLVPLFVWQTKSHQTTYKTHEQRKRNETKIYHNDSQLSTKRCMSVCQATDFKFCYLFFTNCCEIIFVFFGPFFMYSYEFRHFILNRNRSQNRTKKKRNRARKKSTKYI